MSVVADVRRTVRDVLRDVPVARVTTLAEQIDASILPERLIASEKPLHSLFGEYVKFRERTGVVESAITLRILKSSISRPGRNPVTKGTRSS